MKIEVGKYYRTRDGEEVFGPMEEDDVPSRNFTHKGRPLGYSTSCYFGPNGEFWGAGGKEDSSDLVEEVTNAGVDNPGDAVVPRHDTPACDCGPDGSCPVSLEAAVLEQSAKGVWTRVVHGLAALSRVVRGLYRKSDL